MYVILMLCGSRLHRLLTCRESGQKENINRYILQISTAWHGLAG